MSRSQHMSWQRGQSGQAGITLVELLVAMVIMGIVSTMLYMTWFSLNGSAAYSLNSAHARDDAQLAMTRMVSELRDAQGQTVGTVGYPPIQTASLNDIAFATTFNEIGNTDQSMAPRLVSYQYVPASGEILRTVDTDGNGSLSNDTPQVVLTHIVNNIESSTMFGIHYTQTPVFIYSYYDATGQLAHTSNIAGLTSPNSIIDITIRLMVDLKPGGPPTYMDLQCTVEPRNGRWGA
jgi:prepilin-type N-terminal cleavage/methylation domain-containing protein